MIKLLINEQALSVVTPVVVEGTEEYLTLSASFEGEHWDKAVKYVNFNMGEKHLVFTMTDDCIREEAQMNLPRGTWEIYVVGAVYEEEEQVQRITTETQLLEVQIEGVYGREPETEVDPYAPRSGDNDYLVRGDLAEVAFTGHCFDLIGSFLQTGVASRTLPSLPAGSFGTIEIPLTFYDQFLAVGVLTFESSSNLCSLSAWKINTYSLSDQRLELKYRNNSTTEATGAFTVSMRILYIH